LRQRPEQDPIFLQRLESELIGSRSVLAAFRGDLPQTIELSRQALQLLPEENTFLRSVVAMGIGNAYLLSGDFTRASAAYSEVVKTGTLAQNMHCVLAAIGGQGYIDAARGHLHQALATHRRAIQLGTEHGGHIFPIISMSYIYLGDLEYEWNDLEAAERFVRDGIELGKQWGYVGTLSTGYYILARIQLLKGNKDEALAIMQRSGQMVQSFRMQMVVTMAAASEAWIQLKAGHGEAAAQWARTCGLSEHAILAHPREVEHLVLSEILIDQGRYAEALAIVERLLPVAEAAGWGRSAIECLILQAIILQAQGRMEQALHVLARAFSRTESEGYIRIFLDKGAPIIRLLQYAISQGVARDYTRRLLRAAGIVNEEHPGVLSERELLVLRSIAAGKSNQQIAGEFVVALSTVKTHLNNIYMKLGVHSRTQAIVRARELHLLTT
jgi:LuxR family transcriptional regulator, maltose regulon positive regulatory protein